MLFSKLLFKEKSFKHDNSLLTEALKHHKDSGQLLVEFAKLKFVTQLYQEAADNFASAMKYEDISSVETLYNLGLSYLHMDRPEMAVPNFKSLVLLTPA